MHPPRLRAAHLASMRGMLAAERQALAALRLAVARATDGLVVRTPADAERAAGRIYAAVAPVLLAARVAGRGAARAGIVGEAVAARGEAPGFAPVVATAGDRLAAARTAQAYANAWLRAALQRLAARAEAAA